MTFHFNLLFINHKMKYLLSTLLATTGIFGMGAVTLDVKPGELSDALASLGDVHDLTLTGQVDSRDFPALSRAAFSVSELDLSGLQIPSGTLPEYLFCRATLQTVILPETLREIPKGFLASSSVERVVTGAATQSVAPYALHGCEQLSTVVGSERLLRIGEGSMAATPSLHSLSLSSVETIGEYALAGSGIEYLYLPVLRSLDQYALSAIPGLQSIRLNPNVHLGKGSLAACPELREIFGYGSDIPVLFCAFNPNMQTGKMTGHLSKIGDYAFAGTSGETMYFSTDLRYVGKGAFAGMNDLKLIDVSSFGSDIPEVSDDSFSLLDQGSISLHVAEGTSDIWRNHPVWGLFRVTEDDSGMDTLPAAGSVRIIPRAGWVHVEGDGHPRTVEIFDSTGVRRYLGTCTDTLDIPTAGWGHGTLIIRADGASTIKTYGKE